jgi:hypothetical protein
MKTLIITVLVCLYVPLALFAAPADSIPAARDSVQNTASKPVLRVSGTKVYQGNTLLTKTEVLNIMGKYPGPAKLYNKGKNMRGTGGLLIVGGIAAMTGGIVIMVNSFESYDVDNGYSSYTYSGFGDKYYAGLAVATLGELMLDGGIACTIVGKIQIKRSVRNYNTSVNSAQWNPGEVKYHLGLLDNGNIGLRLTF